MNTNCACDWCKKYHPLCEKILFLLQYEDDKKIFKEMIDNLMAAETDAVYWKDKFYGTWPTDSCESIEKRISILTDRIRQLKISKELKNIGTAIEDVVIVYGYCNYSDNMLYAPHVKSKTGKLKFIYNNYELHRLIMPECFSEETEGIYSSRETLENSIDILAAYKYSCYREDSFFQD